MRKQTASTEPKTLPHDTAQIYHDLAEAFRTNNVGPKAAPKVLRAFATWVEKELKNGRAPETDLEKMLGVSSGVGIIGTDDYAGGEDLDFLDAIFGDYSDDEYADEDGVIN